MNNSLSPVTFHGDTIFCFTYQNQPYTAMKPIIENMGLDWRSQAAKLRSNKERWGVAMFTTPTSSGEQEMTCMPVRKLPAFLNTINPKKVRPELRERIELYQNESDDVLWEYWTNQQKAQPQQEFSTVEDRRTLNALVRAWVAASGLSFPDCWSQLHEAFKICDVTEMYLAEVPEAEAWVQARIDACRRPVLDFAPPSKMTRYDTAFSSRDWWQELEAAHKTLEELSGVISYRATTGYLMKHEFLGETVNAQVSLALGSLMMARCALRDALRLRCKVNLSR